MQLNQSVFDRVKKSQKKLVLVTKYWDREATQKILEQSQKQACFWALGENRITALQSKNIPRNLAHFIGHIQTRKIPHIIEHCSVVHSLTSLKHAHIFEEKMETPNLDFFVQVNVSGDPKKEGILSAKLPEFLEQIKDFPKINIIGLSNMGQGEFTEIQKRKEFQDLLDLRNKFLPQKLTSAGTSRDYQLALEEGIDVVRVGQAMMSKNHAIS